MFISLLLTLASSLDLLNYENLQHFAYVDFGQQSLPVMFDTGSEVTWVASVDCISPGCNKHTKFNPYTSPSLTLLHMSFEIEYGSGGIKGELALETIEFDGLTLKNVEIGLVHTLIGPVFDKMPFIGIIGISPSLAQSHILSVIYKTYGLSVIKIGLSQTQTQPGFIYFINESPTTMQLSASETYWQLPVSHFNIGKVDLCSLVKKCKAVIDTGTSVISFPSAGYWKILNEIKLNANCSNAFELPDMEVGILDKIFQIP
jgi:cathepsin D